MSNFTNFGESASTYLAPTRKRSEVDPKAIGSQSMMSNAASLAMAGAQTGNPFAALGGAAAGMFMGILDRNRARRRMFGENAQYMKDFNNENTAYQEGIQGKLDARAASQNGQYFANQYMEKGGKINDIHLDLTMGRIRAEKERRKKTKLFRYGGSVNVIPKGVTHEQRNSLGDHGIPIVSQGMEKIAEIEVNELTLTKEVSEKVERLTEEYHRTYDKTILKEIGKLMKTEITDNTIDLQGDLLKDI